MLGGGGLCDPCTGEQPNSSDLIALGMKEEYIHYSNYFFTRLQARYTLAQATQELMLYQMNMTDAVQYRFIEHKPEMEEMKEKDKPR